MNLYFLLPPLLGAVIGYVTNDIAIRMLFRPLKPVYIGKWKLPFTPGMIPKEQGRIAGAVAHTISADLLDESALRSALLSEEMLCKVDDIAEILVAKLMEMEQSPEALLSHLAGEEKYHQTLNGIKLNASQYICHKLRDSNLSFTLTNIIAEKIKRKMPFLPTAMITPVQEQIIDWLDEMLMNQCPGILYDVIDGEADSWLQKPVGEIVLPFEEKVRAIIPSVRNWYARAIDAALPKILSAIDIEAIVEQKINSFSPAELEKLLRTLMKKELSAIIWLGSLLGFVMGWLNLLIL